MFKHNFCLWVGSLVVAALSVDSSLAQTGSQLSISSTGVPTYTYPIQLPPGIAGMEPKIALAYSGGGVNGPVGNGWSMQGLSAITRCAATPATDNRRVGVHYSSDDKLCLDGQRLIQTDLNGQPLGSPTNDALGLSSGYREYRTERDSFARIRAYGSTPAGLDDNLGGGPGYFRVWTKSDQIYEYGNTADSNVNRRASA